MIPSIILSNVILSVRCFPWEDGQTAITGIYDSIIGSRTKVYRLADRADRPWCAVISTFESLQLMLFASASRWKGRMDIWLFESNIETCPTCPSNSCSSKCGWWALLSLMLSGSTDSLYAGPSSLFTFNLVANSTALLEMWEARRHVYIKNWDMLM